MTQRTVGEPETASAKAAQDEASDEQAMFTDANIAAVLTTLNMSEIETSRIVMEHTTHDGIAEFAQMMIQHHGRAQNDLQAMLDAKEMKPAHNALSLQKERNLEPKLADLRALSGEERDHAYVNMQIVAHEDALHTLDTSLIPSATDPELKAMLVNRIRPSIQQHLMVIQGIHDQIHASST